jgi:purine nucleosidase
MVGWDISYTYALLDPQDAAALRAIGTPLARFCVDIQKAVEQFARDQADWGGYDLPDPIAMAIALDPIVATKTKHCHVTIKTESDLCRGQSVVDHRGDSGREPNAEVVIEASRERFMQILFDAVRNT